MVQQAEEEDGLHGRFLLKSSQVRKTVSFLFLFVLRPQGSRRIAKNAPALPQEGPFKRARRRCRRRRRRCRRRAVCPPARTTGVLIHPEVRNSPERPRKSDAGIREDGEEALKVIPPLRARRSLSSTQIYARIWQMPLSFPLANLEKLRNWVISLISMEREHLRWKPRSFWTKAKVSLALTFSCPYSPFTPVRARLSKAICQTILTWGEGSMSVRWLKSFWENESIYSESSIAHISAHPFLSSDPYSWLVVGVGCI